MDVLLSWSGGKDSAMALWVLENDPTYRVVHLLTTVNDDYDRISIHGVRRSLLRLQAESLGLDLFEIDIPASCSHAVYEKAMGTAFASPLLKDIPVHAFGDLYLQDVRRYREVNVAKLNKEPLFPVWGRDTAAIAREFIELGFRATVACVDTASLSAEFAGREFDNDFLAGLPQGIDPCGENGEFHTFVYDGPMFRFPIRVDRGDTVTRSGFAFADLVESESARGRLTSPNEGATWSCE
jgi:uncharacterized protein (TIGR00290 family)